MYILAIKLNFSEKWSLIILICSYTLIELFPIVIPKHYGQSPRKFWYIQWFKYETSFLFLLEASKSLNSHLVH